MTRQRITQLPGSRGPFPGPASKQLQEMEESLRQQSLVREAGLVWGTETHSAIPGAREIFTPPADTVMLYLLRPLPHRMRLNYARTYIHVPSSGTARAAIYQFSDNTSVVRVGGSEAQFGLSTAGEVTSPTDGEIHLEPWTDYFLGFTTPGGQFTGFVASGTANANSLLPFFTINSAALPDRLNLLDMTKDYMDLDEGVVAITYLTSRGKLLL